MKDERIMDDAKKKENNVNKKTDDFARNMNRNFRNRNSTLFSEVRKIGNKENLEDRQGSKNAYDSPSGLYTTGKT